MTTTDHHERDRRDPRLVRPYTVIGGRVRSHRADLEIEALVATAPVPYDSPKLNPEQQAIARLCRHGHQSIAEISALLKLPLGVVRVLVSDMVDHGLVELYQPSHASDRPDRALLERVLDGLRRI